MTDKEIKPMGKYHYPLFVRALSLIMFPVIIALILFSPLVLFPQLCIAGLLTFMLWYYAKAVIDIFNEVRSNRKNDR